MLSERFVNSRNGDSGAHARRVGSDACLKPRPPEVSARFVSRACTHASGLMTEMQAPSADRWNVGLGGDRGWRLWPHFVLRSAGFPAAGVDRLAVVELAEAARRTEDAIGPGANPAQDFETAYAVASVGVGAEVHAIAATPRFQRALVLQNPGAFDFAVGGLLARPQRDSRRDRKRRWWERAVASYWQRYCVKNDSIGFFGPIGWGRVAPGERSTVSSAEAVTADCRLFFEGWAIDAVADALARDPAVRQAAAPRRLPFVRIDSTVVRVPQQSPVTVPPIVATVLRACDGVTPAWALVELVSRESSDPVSAGHVVSLLEDLSARRWIAWKFDLPVGPHPERMLLEMLRRLPDQNAQARAIAPLTELVRLKEGVEEAAADVPALRSALAALDDAFVATTGASATRHHGRTYGGRTVSYLDCRRACDVVLGDAFVEALGPLELVLASARWLTFHAGRLAREACRRGYDALVREHGVGEVNVSALWFACLPRLAATRKTVQGELMRDLRMRWAEILDDPGRSAVPRLEFVAADLRPRVLDAFEAPGPGWESARYCSPDILIAAKSIDALDSGDFQLVLGELHVAINTLIFHAFLAQSADPESVLEHLDHDFPEPRLVPVLPKEIPPRLTPRTHPLLGRPRDYFVEVFHYSVDHALPGLRLASDLVIEDQDGRLVVTVAPGTSFDVLDIFSEVLLEMVVHDFAVLEPAEHTPRVTLDRLVVARETWRFDADELAPAVIGRETDQFIKVCRWVAERSLPRRVFVSSPLEMKPFYVDFESPLYVAMFAKAVRRVLDRTPLAAIKLVEMLPAPDALWLSDASGERYTSEVRMTAFDLAGASEVWPGRSV